ncbi:hypothetical protein RYX36_031212 [Vicia faba]
MGSGVYGQNNGLQRNLLGLNRFSHRNVDGMQRQGEDRRIVGRRFSGNSRRWLGLLMVGDDPTVSRRMDYGRRKVGLYEENSTYLAGIVEGKSLAESGKVVRKGVEGRNVKVTKKEVLGEREVKGERVGEVLSKGFDKKTVSFVEVMVVIFCQD